MAIECLGKSKFTQRALHSPKTMGVMIGQDVYKCEICGFTLTGLNLVKGGGENEYWRTTEDLGNSRTSQGAGQFTGLRAYAANGTISASTYYNLVGTSSLTWTNQSKTSSITSEYKPLPVEKRAEPIRALRCAMGVEVINRVVVFRGITGPKYTADDRALCTVHPTVHHWTQIPVESCTCGFHGMKEEFFVDEITFTIFDIVLDVEFYGRVIEGERGYRAQYQRIIDVYSDGELELPGFNVKPFKKEWL